MTELFTLPLLFEMEEMSFYIYPVVIKNNDSLIMVDVGYPMFLSDIEKAFDKIGLNIHNLTQVILTHYDHDHMGAANELIEKYPNIEVKCSKEQEPYILGKKKSLRLELAERNGETLKGDAKKFNDGFIQMLRSVKYLDNVTTLSDGDMICDGVKVIETPGHMPGHISLYFEPEKTLISGDMLVSEDGVLAIADKRFVLDEEEEIKSIEKIMNYDIEKIICYHGGEYSSNRIKEELRDIINNGYSN
ncbi:MBL fold metallo-hydrolase [Anaerosacchariphilus polymeriproducens]|uniref:MBL fold metallo-hydrolase n=1 Tax=Anaerosacchariphilus polymeriproducens TaxID=1812858 RepID=A0A371AYK6_9FIRM|nr:MBL fold metallo-hydrolase [Anaerosacchariphilus polymeriproducens]RDU24675.1 MBL fold metallo-hydrolase [Anaerosacchariphilus polymeriproducens]